MTTTHPSIRPARTSRRAVRALVRRGETDRQAVARARRAQDAVRVEIAVRRLLPPG